MSNQLNKPKMKTTILFAALASTMIFASCRKEKKEGCTDPMSVNYDANAESNNGSCEYAGTGGNVTIVAFPKHHGVDTRPYHAYIKFNTQEFPGTNPSAYDLDILADTTENHIEIENLKRGKYFIYMTAYDTAIAELVFGGIPITITQTSGEIDINVPVVE
jgi:hypothetical protein